MQKDSFNIQDIDPNIIVISLVDLVANVWRSRWMVLTVTVLVAILGVARESYFATYKSEGLIWFGGVNLIKEYNVSSPIETKGTDDIQSKVNEKTETETEVKEGVSMSDYKRLSVFFNTSARFADYVREKKLDSAPGIDYLLDASVSIGGVEKLLEATKGCRANAADCPPYVTGIRVYSDGADPQTAQQSVDTLGHYLMDSIVYSIFSDGLQLRQNQFLDNSSELDKDIMEDKMKLEELSRRGADLKQILSRYSGLASLQVQQGAPVAGDSKLTGLHWEQLVTAEAVSQLVAIETQTLEINEQILKVKREQQRGPLFREYYQQLKILLESTKSGETVLRGLESVKDRVFKDKNLDDELIKEVYSMITADNNKAINAYFEQSLFITGPSLPVKSSARPVRALIISLIGGLCLSVVLVFGRNWWRENRTKVYG